MSAGQHYRFGPFTFDGHGRVLLRDSKDLGLPPKAADTLNLLLEHAGSVVDKGTLLDSVWPGVVVGEGSLTRTVSILRKALGGNDASRAYIATVSKRGYRFVAPLDRGAAEEPAQSRTMLAVLPIENLSSSRRHDYFSDGLTEEMIAQLSTLNPERLGVIARTSSMMFKGTAKRIGEIGRDLGAHYIVQGSVRRERGRVRIAAQLIQVRDETHVWADTYEREAGDMLRLQCEVAQAIAREIQIKLTPRVARRFTDTSDIPAATYQAFLRGRHFLNQRTESGMRDSIAQFEAALEHCPTHAPAYAGIADANVMLACRGMVPARETFRRARSAARRALDLDAESGDARASLAHVRLHDWDWEGLDQDFRRATELSPSHAIAYYWYGEYLMCQGRPEEAIATTEAAVRLDPLSPVIRSALGMILYLARRYDRASEVLVDAVETTPEHFLPHLRLGLVRIQQQRFADAIRCLKLSTALASRSTETQAALAMAYAASGERAKAARIVKQFERQRGKRYVLPYNIAKIHAAAKDRTRAFEWLETAYEGGNPDLIELNSEPLFDPIRDDKRFTHLMRRIGWSV
ncbi:MAG TPA: tetratricopeptide repeat protein [Steroidobacteraceae bacterium]|nr:tetratricopeptide repeat protein [Steroidobacteraceae bacterium]